MKRSENSQTPVCGAISHRFPNIADGGRAFCSDAGTPERDQFQPLFLEATASDINSAPNDGAIESDHQMGQARQRGYDNGVEAGRQDARQMAADMIAPRVDGFRQELERLASYRENIADHASTHMIKLAVAIAERIMGVDVHVTAADLQPLRQTLIDAICSRYELHLRYHPKDLSHLQRLMACKGELRWRTDGGLSIEEDLNVAQGAVINGREAGEGASIADQVQPSLQQLLINVYGVNKVTGA